MTLKYRKTLRDIRYYRWNMGTYIRLVEYSSQEDKKEKFIELVADKQYFVIDSSKFKGIKGFPYAYMASKHLVEILEKDKTLGELAKPRQGLASGANDKFYRFWYEVNFSYIAFGKLNKESVWSSGCKYVPVNKGGGYRKWYGNNYEIIKFDQENYNLLANSGNRLPSRNLYFLEGITWNKISSGRFSCRYSETGYIFTDAGMKMISENNIKAYGGLLASNVVPAILKLFSETLNYETGNISRIPVHLTEEDIPIVENIFQKCVEISKKEWDDFEISWNYLSHPLIRGNNVGRLIADKFIEIQKLFNDRFDQLKSNEEELNRIFIEIYGLQKELTSKVSDDDISVRKANLEREIKSLISYAIGCIMGRYSLKEDGLIYAGGTWDYTRYDDGFKPCDNGVMIITEEQYFEEDLCTRVIDFIEFVYGKDTLNENIEFIAQALKPGTKESARQVIRNYLYDEKGFFDNHYQVYQHRPIYWMMSSGKNGGFRALMYMHRYNSNTLSIVRSDFLHELRYKYEADQFLQHKKISEAATTADRNDARKKIAALDKKIVEIHLYDELINHVTGNIAAFTFDLDDGVKTNYSKFLNIDGVKNQNLLIPIKL